MENHYDPLMSTAVSDTGTRSRGRPREFDEQAVLDAVQALFWQQGYEATSLADIVEASGLNKSSLYNAFGSKQQLFALVLDRYINARLEMLVMVVDSVGDGIDGLHGFLDAIKTEVDGEFGQQGCLAINVSAEIGSLDPEVKDFSQNYRDRMHAALVQVVTRASTKNGLDQSLIEQRADMLLVFMLGMSVAVRGGAGGDEVDRLFASAHGLVESWRT